MKEIRDIHYFIVQAKCGHVGKGRYIPVDFPIRTINAKRAASIVRRKPGVKHDHSNAILSVREANVVEYLLFRRIFRDDLYWKWATRNYEALMPRIREEGPYHRLDKPSRVNEIPLKTNKAATRAFRIRRNHCLEKSVRRDIIKEYGLTV